MTPWLAARVRRFGKIIERYFDDPLQGRYTGEIRMARHDLGKDQELRQATEDMQASAVHAKFVANMVSKATDPNDPDSFESVARNLLRRIQ